MFGYDVSMAALAAFPSGFPSSAVKKQAGSVQCYVGSSSEDEARF
jgi:hypothetical protein